MAIRVSLGLAVRGGQVVAHGGASWERDERATAQAELESVSGIYDGQATAGPISNSAHPVIFQFKAI